MRIVSQGLTKFSELENTAAPNATIPVVYFTPSGVAANIDVAFLPKGTGAFILSIPDSTTTGGNKRGTYAVDFQRVRNAASQVASGSQSTILNGQWNTAAGSGAIAGGLSSSAAGSYSVALGYYANATTVYSTAFGYNCTASNNSSFAAGYLSTASGSVSVCISQNSTASGNNAACIGGQNNVASGSYSFAGGSGCTSSSTASFAHGNQSSATGPSSVALGYQNGASGHSAFAAGSICSASADNSFSFGEYNQATGIASTVRGRNGTARTLTNVDVFAGGQRAALGDTQVMKNVHRATTVDATLTTLTCGGGAASSVNVMVMPNNSACHFYARVVVMTASAAIVASWLVECTVKRVANAASTAIVGGVTVTPFGQDAGAALYTVTVAADTTNGAPVIQVSGAGYWVAYPEMVQVA